MIASFFTLSLVFGSLVAQGVQQQGVQQQGVQQQGSDFFAQQNGFVGSVPMSEIRIVLPNANPISVLMTSSLDQWPTTVRVILKPDEFFEIGDQRTGSQTSGFFVELFAIIQRLTGTAFNIVARPDLLFARPNANGTFDGTILAPLLDNTADLVGSAVITSYGEAEVDFLVPILPFKLRILYNPRFGLTRNVQYVVADNQNLFYLKSSKNATLQAIYKNIIAGLPGSVVESHAAGVAKVISGNFAFIEANHLIAQALQVNGLNLAVAPGNLGKYFYRSLAVQKGSPLRKLLNIQILKLVEDDTFLALLEKYNLLWMDKRSGSNDETGNVNIVSSPV